MTLQSSVQNKVTAGEQTRATEKSTIWERGFRDAGSGTKSQPNVLYVDTMPKPHVLYSERRFYVNVDVGVWMPLWLTDGIV